MKLPVFPQGKHQIIDECSNYVGTVKDKRARDYIIKAINSHEKLVEALRIYGHHCRTDDSTMCEHMKHNDYPCTCGFEQALKEAEKE